MRINNHFFRLLLLTVTLSLPLAADNQAPSAALATTQPLFLIERSKNANEVHYVARLAKSGGLDVKSPVHAFWINWEKDSTGNKREELNLFEKRMAFGFSVDRSRGPQSCTIKLVCFPDRPIRVSISDGIAHAETAINGQPAYIERIKVVTREKKLIPQVLSVTVVGNDIATGDSVEETIRPH
jgi:hypothetical protein